MEGEISYDLEPCADMAFEEGTYRLAGKDWQVFIISRSDVPEPAIKDCQWRSGVTGFYIEIPRSDALNHEAAADLLSKITGVTRWSIVQGPDSMQLR